MRLPEEDRTNNISTNPLRINPRSNSLIRQCGTVHSFAAPQSTMTILIRVDDYTIDFEVCSIWIIFSLLRGQQINN